MNKIEEIKGLIASLSGACIQYGFDLEGKRPSTESFVSCGTTRDELESAIKALHDENVAISHDAVMYQWIKSQKSLDLRTDGSAWTRDGKPFIASHRLAVDGTQYGAYESLDELITSAMNPSTSLGLS